jgi:hypothetical protein
MTWVSRSTGGKESEMLNLLGFLHGDGLARRVLLLGVVLCTGCIVPTPLQQAEQTPNYRPVIVASLMKPPLGQLQRTTADSDAIDVYAEDANLDDVLKARLFKQTSSTSPRAYTGVQIDLDFPTPPDPMLPTRRVGHFPLLRDCGVLGNASGLSSLFVVVADRDFSNEAGKEFLTIDNGGLTDEKFWDIICP